MHGRRDAPETERHQSGKDGAQSDAYEAASFKVHSRTLSNPKDVEPMQEPLVYQRQPGCCM